ncbi:MAG: HAMP domain-containing histidine kinase [Verrucomicrobia bacterium]|nr:HAMP domain-containing histidine kinase [Verrucomicrobiota bacterium]MDE3099995.1 HAMP domain-containing histidine kinase [Verrucomicrobiota bacterium]
MKVFKSIKWRLQIWYGVILLVVLAGLGLTAYQLQRNRQFRQIDDELHRRFSIVAAWLRPPPRPGRPPFGGEPDGGPLPQLAPEMPPPPASGFHPPPQAAGLFDTNDPNGFCFAVWTPDGREIAHAGRLPGDLPPQAIGDRSNRGPNGPAPGPPATRTVGSFREISGRLPSGQSIIVGRSIASDLAALRRSAATLAGVGAIILFVGLAGGWRLVSLALRPIESISHAAAKISAGDLSQRINAAETESELGKLAAVLNATFARLDAAFAREKQFTADAAHELRTPVSVVLTETQTALNHPRHAAEYIQAIETCHRAAQRMRGVIGRLLELARLDSGREPMMRSNLDLSKIASDCIDGLVPLTANRRIKISAALAPLPITGDPDQLAQVVTNLLANAIQYNRPDGEVRVKSAAQDGMAVLTISDNGRGISAADVPHIFERFYRSDKSRSAGNAGLGLAISKAIITAHGGTIEVRSEENKGTEFTIRLPGAAND